MQQAMAQHFCLHLALAAVVLLPAWAAAQSVAGELRAPCNTRDLTHYLNYPPKAAQCGLEGTVVVAFEIRPGGAVANIAIDRSSHRIFNRSALEAVKRLQCDASRAGTRVEVPIEFRIVDGAPSKDNAAACVDDKPLQAADPGGA